MANENIGPEPVDVKVNAQFARSTRPPGAILREKRRFVLELPEQLALARAALSPLDNGARRSHLWHGEGAPQ
jgi:hypothetical protein